MYTKFLPCCFLLLFICSSTAYAASIGFQPTSSTVNLGQTVTLDIVMDFSDNPTTGGGVDLYFDTSAFRFSQFTFNSSFPTDPAFTHSPTLVDGHLDALAFGSFDGISGPAIIGTLALDTLATGSFTLTMGPTQNLRWDGGFSNAIDYSLNEVQIGSATINVSAVPNPSSFWLFVSGVTYLTRRSALRYLRKLAAVFVRS